MRRLVTHTRRGQAAVEFALIVGLFILVVGGVIQFATILWSQNTITQIARDTARWAVTQSTSPCDSAPSRTALAATADQLARQWGLVDYTAGSWTSAVTFASLGSRGVGAEWPIPPSSTTTYFPTDCPPADNALAWFVQVRVNHSVPIFVPGLQFIAPPCGTPGFCISTTAELRMEPKSP